MSTPLSHAELTPSGNYPSEHRRRLAERKFRWWMEALADAMLSHPGATDAQLAAMVNRAPSTVHLIRNSDAFKGYYAQRRADMTESIDAAIKAKLGTMTATALTHLDTAMEKKRENLGVEALTRIVDTGLKALGYSGAHSGAVQVNVNNHQATLVPVPVSLEDIQAAQRAYRSHQERLANATISAEGVRVAPPALIEGEALPPVGGPVE